MSPLPLHHQYRGSLVLVGFYRSSLGPGCPKDSCLFGAGPISDQKENNRYSGVQGLALTWGGEGGSNLDFLNLEAGAIFF